MCKCLSACTRFNHVKKLSFSPIVLSFGLLGTLVEWSACCGWGVRPHPAVVAGTSAQVTGVSVVNSSL